MIHQLKRIRTKADILLTYGKEGVNYENLIKAGATVKVFTASEVKEQMGLNKVGIKQEFPYLDEIISTVEKFKNKEDVGGFVIIRPDALFADSIEPLYQEVETAKMMRAWAFKLVDNENKTIGYFIANSLAKGLRDAVPQDLKVNGGEEWVKWLDYWFSHFLNSQRYRSSEKYNLFAKPTISKAS